MIEETSAETLNSNFTEALEKASLECIPRGCREKYTPFWNQDIEKAINRGETARCNLDTPENKNLYNKACAQVKLSLVSQKKQVDSNNRRLDLTHIGSKAFTYFHCFSLEKNPVK